MFKKSVNKNIVKRLDGRHIKYVTERMPDGIDSVIGKDGALIIKGDEFLVYASADVVFRVKTDELQASELLSLEGVILTAPDIQRNREVRTVIAYYTHYTRYFK
ncbi:MAG: hypothetical protein FWF15_10960 [Oscillospiraceae bacterium]|nr:hypothetical protein [Oscillospiraceae bacterium]